MAVNAVGDAPLVKGASRRGLSIWAKKVQTGATANGGGALLTQATPFQSIVAAFATLDAGVTPPGAAGALVSCSISGANVLIERYQLDASATPAWVDSTTDMLVNLIVVGVE